MSSNIIHLCPSLHCAGMLTHAIGDRVLPFDLPSLANGFLPALTKPEAWFREQRELIRFDDGQLKTVDKTAIEDILIGRQVESSVGIWFGDLLEEQLFGILAIYFLSILSYSPQMLFFACENRKNPVRGMTGMTPKLLQGIKGSEVNTEIVGIVNATWQSITVGDPVALNELPRIAKSHSLLSTLPSLRKRFPSAKNGLSNWEELVLQRLVSGPQKMAVLVAEVITNDEVSSDDRMGSQDLMHLIVGLTRVQLPFPLLQLDRPNSVRTSMVLLTEHGVAVLKGNVHHLVLNSIQKSLFGVKICPATPWVFDGMQIRLLSSARE